MNTTWKARVLAAVLALGVAGLVSAAGMFVFPQVVPGTYNSVALPAPDGIYTQVQPGQNFTPPIPSNCCGPFVPMDTNQTGGAAPATVRATPFQIAGTLLEGINNTQTSTVHAATSNTLGGVVVTESLSTAAGASYTFTLTNSVLNTAYITAGYIPQVAIYSLSNTGGRANLSGNVTSSSTGNQSAFSGLANTAQMTLVSATPANGSVVWVWRNDGTTALNGTMFIAWHL
jgi:hypothetical protein